MSPVESVGTCLAKYTDFSGRASRGEYWWFSAAFYVLLLASQLSFGPLGLTAGILLACPFLAVEVRRLRDSGISGWWLLLRLLHIPGWVVLAFLCARPSVGTIETELPIRRAATLPVSLPGKANEQSDASQAQMSDAEVDGSNQRPATGQQPETNQFPLIAFACLGLMIFFYCSFSPKVFSKRTWQVKTA